MTTSTLAILRHARTTSETVAAVDHLLSLGYSIARARRAARPALDVVDGALAALSLADQEAAETAAHSVMESTVRTERPLAWRLLRAECIRDIAEATWTACACEACIGDDFVACLASQVHDRCERVVVIARADLARSDEPREYEVRDEGATWEITSSPSEIDADVEASVRDGDWGADGAWVWSGGVSCEIDGYSEMHSVEFVAALPDCTEAEHDWQSPHSVLGGCDSNPGVWGNGGGVVIKEVCSHCGIYQLTDTAASDGSGGTFRAVSYRDADDASLAWVNRRVLAADVKALESCSYELAPHQLHDRVYTTRVDESDYPTEQQQDAELAEIRATLPAGWEAEWHGRRSDCRVVVRRI